MNVALNIFCALVYPAQPTQLPMEKDGILTYITYTQILNATTLSNISDKCDMGSTQTRPHVAFEFCRMIHHVQKKLCQS